MTSTAETMSFEEHAEVGSFKRRNGVRYRLRAPALSLGEGNFKRRLIVPPRLRLFLAWQEPWRALTSVQAGRGELYL